MGKWEKGKRVWLDWVFKERMREKKKRDIFRIVLGLFITLMARVDGVESHRRMAPVRYRPSTDEKNVCGSRHASGTMEDIEERVDGWSLSGQRQKKWQKIAKETRLESGGAPRRIISRASQVRCNSDVGAWPDKQTMHQTCKLLLIK